MASLDVDLRSVQKDPHPPAEVISELRPEPDLEECIRDIERQLMALETPQDSVTQSWGSDQNRQRPDLYSRSLHQRFQNNDKLLKTCHYPDHYLHRPYQHIQNCTHFLRNKNQHFLNLYQPFENPYQHLQNSFRPKHFQKLYQHLRNPGHYLQNPYQHIKNPHQHLWNTHWHLPNQDCFLQNPHKHLQNLDLRPQDRSQHLQNPGHYTDQHIQNHDQYPQNLYHHPKNPNQNLHNRPQYLQNSDYPQDPNQYSQNHDQYLQNPHHHPQNANQHLHNRHQYLQNSDPNPQNPDQHLDIRHQHQLNPDQSPQDSVQHLQNPDHHHPHNIQDLQNPDPSPQGPDQNLDQDPQYPEQQTQDLHQHPQDPSPHSQDLDQHPQDLGQRLQNPDHSFQDLEQHIQGLIRRLQVLQTHRNKEQLLRDHKESLRELRSKIKNLKKDFGVPGKKPLQGPRKLFHEQFQNQEKDSQNSLQDSQSPQQDSQSPQQDSQNSQQDSGDLETPICPPKTPFQNLPFGSNTLTASENPPEVLHPKTIPRIKIQRFADLLDSFYEPFSADKMHQANCEEKVTKEVHNEVEKQDLTLSIEDFVKVYLPEGVSRYEELDSYSVHEDSFQTIIKPTQEACKDAVPIEVNRSQEPEKAHSSPSPTSPPTFSTLQSPPASSPSLSSSPFPPVTPTVAPAPSTISAALPTSSPSLTPASSTANVTSTRIASTSVTFTSVASTSLTSTTLTTTSLNSTNLTFTTSCLPPKSPTHVTKAGNRRERHKAFTCIHCKAGFRTRCLLLQHTQTHTGEKLFCKKCRKECKSIQGLRCHERRSQTCSLYRPMKSAVTQPGDLSKQAKKKSSRRKSL